MRSVESLLTEAVDKCHGQAELARQLGMKRQDIHSMVKGERVISPETVALLGDVLELPGEEVQRLVALAIIGNAKNTGKRERLRKAFFGYWVVGAVATTLLGGAPTEATAKTSNGVSAVTYKGEPYIHCRACLGPWLRRFITSIKARAAAFAAAWRGLSTC
jgi:plasmid maintenance system antidote protein VapI